jgi:uracil-DNA glycosylase
MEIIVPLGKVAFDTTFDAFRELELTKLRKRPAFGHGKEYPLNERHTVIASFHPSQQNTFTGKLTAEMFESLFKRVREVLGKAED